MSNRGRWALMGLSLLLLSPAIDRGVEAGALARGPQLTHSQIQAVLQARNPLLGSSRGERITQAIARCERDQRLRPSLVLAVMKVESGMRPSALSPKGAIGLMQVMPSSFRGLELPGAIAHLETNIEAGCMLLSDNIRRRGERDGISAYFWGNRIQGPGYFERVQAALDDLALEVEAEDARGRS
jgi:soluble lytic murein transglycosylase-like protein